jgi:NADPH-dependent glutamate synthase beta subunit-like oxidoreductase
MAGLAGEQTMSPSDPRTGAQVELPFQIYARQLAKLPPCQARCPNSGDIRGWLGIIAQREKNGLSLDEAFDAAWRRLVEFNPLPATIGRICPHPCEDLCSRSNKDGAVSINAMERFLGDWGISRGLALPDVPLERQPESVGVVGSGPASLSFAYQMAIRGYHVTIYERDEHPGGMLRHAIPDYRLPRDVLDAEVDRIMALGIVLAGCIDVGEDITLDELSEKHKLVFLGLGAQAARHLGVPGEDGPGVISGLDFLRRRKAGQETGCGRNVLVIGHRRRAQRAPRRLLGDSHLPAQRIRNAGHGARG